MTIATAAVLCRMVDNFGDAGVCFRLARQLVAEHRIDTTLWIDDPASLRRIASDRAAPAGADAIAGVRIRRLDDTASAPDPLPDLLVEGFGCGVPPQWLAAMAQAARPPVWIILEYLSAEPWIDGAHALPSPHPRLPLERWFWFPGFSTASGGLLRERNLLCARDAFEGDAEAIAAYWNTLGLSPPAAGELALSVFVYPNQALPDLLDAWTRDPQPLRAVFAEGTASAALSAWAGDDVAPGNVYGRGMLTVVVAPFVPQDAFDRRLWGSDLNVVRGEDSFVRAQWAGKPFVWHIYAQAEAAHEVKLEAFLSRYTDGLDRTAAIALRDFWSAFNAQDGVGAARAWPALRSTLPTLAGHARRWADALARRADLATGLVDFVRSRL